VQVNQAGYARWWPTRAGVVTGVEAEPASGRRRHAGRPLAHDGPRDAVFSVPEDRVGALRQLLGQPARCRLLPWSGEPRQATVREVAAAADPVTRTFLVKADVRPCASALGQTADGA
jgi:hypothetical protein